MAGAIVLIILLFVVTQSILQALKRKHRFLSIDLMNKLFGWHFLFWGFYYWYQTLNPSDSKGYYEGTRNDYSNWFEAFGTDTKFIDFVGYPFAKTLDFSYPSMMALFAWFGFLGFVYFYIFFRENIKTKVKVFGFDAITLIMFLPNMHFWTVAFSKGSLIFLGISLFAYAMRLPQKRIVALLIGSLIVFQIRPHVFMFLAAGAAVGYFTGKDKVPMYQKLLVYISCIGGLILFYEQVLAMVHINLEEESFVEGFEQFASDRASSLSRSDSGIDINSYPLPLKLLTFWFRPLFFDAPGVMGIFVSAENLFYLYLAYLLVDRNFIRYLRNSTSLVKMSITIFLTSSLALAFVMANLGIAMRQKSMVMYFLFFVIVSFLDYKRQRKIQRYKLLQQQQKEEEELLLKAHA